MWTVNCISILWFFTRFDSTSCYFILFNWLLMRAIIKSSKFSDIRDIGISSTCKLFCCNTMASCNFKHVHSFEISGSLIIIWDWGVSGTSAGEVIFQVLFSILHCLCSNLRIWVMSQDISRRCTFRRGFE